METGSIGLDALTPTGFPPRLSGPAALTGTEDQRSFRDVLGLTRARTGPARADATPEERARIEKARERESHEAATRLVAKTFLEPILAQVRDASDAAPPFAPTRAEKQLRSLSDARLAYSIVERAQMPIVDRLARDLLKFG